MILDVLVNVANPKMLGERSDEGTRDQAVGSEVLKRIRKALFKNSGAIILILSSMQASAEDLRAYYSLDVAFPDGSSSKVQTSSTVLFGKAITHEFGDKLVSLLFVGSEDKADSFTVEISVESIPRDTSAFKSLILRQNFGGKISTRQEFSQSQFNIDEASVNLSLALRLSRLD